MTDESTTQLAIKVAAQLAYYVGGPALVAYFLFQLFTQVMH